VQQACAGNLIDADEVPDYQIEGRILDNYAPTTGNPRSIWTTVQGKVASGQTTRVVLNVTGTKIDIAALKTQFQKWPIDGLEEVVAVTATRIERIWP
jgi:hypothetical protein